MLDGVTVTTPEELTAVPRETAAGYRGDMPTAGPATIMFE
jgi:hypothetical protein